MRHDTGFLERFLPAGTDLSPEERTRGLNLAGISFALGIAGLFFTLRYLLLGVPLGSLGVLIASLVALSCPVVMRLSGSISIARILALLTLSALLFWLCFVANGVMSSPVFWFAVVPVAAIFTGGRRHGLIWTPVTVLVILMLHLGDKAGWFAPLAQLPEDAIRPIQVSSSLVLVVVMSALAMLFERARKQGVSRLEALTGELEHAGKRMARDSHQIGETALSVGRRLAAQEEQREAIDRQLRELAEAGEHAQDAARQMAEAAASTERLAGEGGELVHESTTELARLSETVEQSAAHLNHLAGESQSLMEIISLIDNIAMQTHRLALNASIEAARAGPEGRSFGVVAEEVRALAERSRSAARDIGGRIDTLVAGIQEGASGMQEAGSGMTAGRERAAKADSALGEIVETTQQLSSQSQMVARATQQQTQSESALREGFETLSETLASVARSSDEIDEAAGAVAEALRSLEARLAQRKRHSDTPDRSGHA